MTSKIFNKLKKEKGIYVKSSIVERFIYKSSTVESFDVESFDDVSGVAVRSGVGSGVESFDDGSDVGSSVEGKR